ncbi:MAG: prepilin-type N-terminal cleavage/methylation domain-containing protein [Chitinispirillia bacterium]|jgi:prepilin-type N-terminal cleavage/methylation domain-containing protein
MVLKDTGRQGFTFIELMVAISITGSIMFIIANFLSNEIAASERYMNTTQLRQNVRFTMDLIIRETKMAGYNPKKMNHTWISTLNDTLKIFADLNGDSDVVDEDEQIYYWYSPCCNSIYRKTVHDNQQEILLEDVISFQLEGRDSSNNPTTVSSDIKKIYLSIEGRVKVPRTFGNDNNYRKFPMESIIILRNLN